MLFGSSGIRQLYDHKLLDLALKVGSAVGTNSKNVLVGIDARTTGPLLAHAFISGVLFSGADVDFGGISPTPSIAFGVGQGADAGCVITASHNPEPYNGMKLINPDGSSFKKEQQADIERLVAEFHWSDWGHQGRLRNADFISPHIHAICDAISINTENTMFLDCGNGAGSLISPYLLSRLGVHTRCLNCNVSGIFSRPSEPLEAHVPYISSLIRAQQADGAIIHDGDADRMMAFDGKGRYIRGDHLLMLFSMYLGSKRIVTTVDASMAIEEIGEVRRTPVGDTYVSEELLSWGDFGGEPSGSWIFPKHSLCPDGIYAAALFCQITSEWDVAGVIDGMPTYPILRLSVPCKDPAPVLKKLGASKPTDGIRLEEEDGWCLIRASGTEPKIRITAEGKSKKKAKELARKGRALLKKANTD
jgi:phosphoglucosamine mutase